MIINQNDTCICIKYCTYATIFSGSEILEILNDLASHNHLSWSVILEALNADFARHNHIMWLFPQFEILEIFDDLANKLSYESFILSEPD